MRNHSDDNFEGDSGITLPETTVATRVPSAQGDPRRRWMEAGASDDLAFALALLALTEGGDP
jgi:hypothetical protein